MKRQVVVIHGGDTFDTYEDYFSFLKVWQIDFERYRSQKKDWKSTLAEKLGERYEVIAPAMPSKMNAKYAEWKIWFEKFIPHLASEVVLVGHSLGGTFLVKYLAENDFSKKVLALFLVAAPFGDSEDYSLADFRLPGDLSRVNKEIDKIFLYHSKDDQVVPFGDLEKFHASFPAATTRIFSDRGHFNQEEFPELVSDVRSI